MALEYYEIPCQCGETIALRQDCLQHIVNDLQWSDRVSPAVTFVCQQCKAAIPYDYANRKPAGVVEEANSPMPFAGIVRVKCGDLFCGNEVELIVVRDSDTTADQLWAEIENEWDRSKMVCERHLSAAAA
jgi:hypothetical protein